MQRRTTPRAYTGRKVVCYVTRNRATHKARKVCRPVGGYSRLTARKVLWGPAGMPPAPKDFGPHFDFPAHSLNSGPTEAPYPGWLIHLKVSIFGGVVIDLYSCASPLQFRNSDRKHR